MSITITGYIFILLTFYGLFFNPKRLYELTIFFLPFSATAVINIGLPGEGSAIQPYMFMGFFWMLSFYFSNAKNLKLDSIEFKSIRYLLLFVFTALVSLIMPLYISGTEYGNITGKLGEYLPITFTSKNFTQFLYLLYGVLLAITLYFKNKAHANFERTIKIYSNAIIFVIAWGLLELSSHYLGFKYPSIIFNNSYSSSAGGFGAILDEESGIRRIASVAVEASILTQTVVILLPFLIFGQLNKKYFYSRGKDLIYIVVIILFILRSTSTTGLVGLIFLCFVCSLFYLKMLNKVQKMNMILKIAVILPIFAMGIYFLFNDYIINVLFSKGSSYSALERSQAILGAWQNFTHYPILGTGWGSVSSFDLFVRILSNVGITGVLFFIMFIITNIKNQLSLKHKLIPNSYYSNSLITSLITLLFTNAISGFSFTFGYFWLIIGLSLVSKFKDSTASNYQPGL